MAKHSKVIRATLTDAEARRLTVAAARKGVPTPQYVGDAIRAALNGGKK